MQDQRNLIFLSSEQSQRRGLQGIPLLINDHIYVEVEMPLWFVVFDHFYDFTIGMYSTNP